MPRIASFTSQSLLNIGRRAAAIAATYSVSWGSASYNEGNTAIATVTTTGVDDNTTVGYTITGLSTNDLSAGTLTGTVTITNSSGTVTITLAEDSLTEGTDTATITLAAQDSAGNTTGSPTASMNVQDTSNDPNATPWLDDNDDIVTVRTIIGSTSMTFNAVFAVNPTTPFDIEGRTSGTTTTVTAITARTATFIEVDDTGNSTNFVIGEEVNIVA